jgi:hypothetical protein
VQDDTTGGQVQDERMALGKELMEEAINEVVGDQEPVDFEDENSGYTVRSLTDHTRGGVLGGV